MHDFDDSYRRGKEGEKDIDAAVAHLFVVEPVTLSEEKRFGVDRIWRLKQNHEIRMSVEYKTDDKAAKSRNAFIETISVDTNGSPGWAMKSVAQIFAYYVPPKHTIYLWHMSMIKVRLLEWVAHYPLASSPNRGYLTWGRLVPLKRVYEVAGWREIDTNNPNPMLPFANTDPLRVWTD